MHSAAKVISGWLLMGVWLLVGLPAAAQTSSGTQEEELPPVAHEKALQTFREGIDAFDRRDFEAARVAFLQTFALKPSAPVVRRNLGLAEIYSGHYLEGARRLARVIHTTDEGTSQDRARMLESLKKAEAHLERVTIEVNEEGAEIVIDDVALGSSPLPLVWYVPPGSYRVRVSKAGFATFSETRLARAGTTQHLRIVLASEQPVTAAPLAPLAADPAVDRGGPSPWLLATGGTLAAGGVAVGVTFSLFAAANSDKVQRLGSSLASMGGCQVRNLRGCDDLSRAASQHDQQVRWATVSFAVAGVAGVTTLVYGLVASSDARRGHERSASSPVRDAAPRLAFGFDTRNRQLLVTTSF
jgi:hypothetical protein